jgi:protein ImuA
MRSEAAHRVDELARAGLVRRGAGGLATRVGRVVPTGIAAVDAILPGGGVPCGCVTEVAGPPSCGKLAVATRVLVGVLAAGERAALVDTTRSFFPALSPALARALAPLLVCRVSGAADGLAAAELLAGSGAMALVVVDLVTARGPLDAAARAAVARLERAGRDGQAAVLAVTQPARGAGGVLGPDASLRLEVSADRVWPPSRPAESRVRVARSRFGPPGAAALVG